MEVMQCPGWLNYRSSGHKYSNVSYMVSLKVIKADFLIDNLTRVIAAMIRILCPNFEYLLSQVCHQPLKSVQYSTVQYSMAWYSTIQYSTVRTVWYITVWYSTETSTFEVTSKMWYCTVQYSKVQYSTVEYSTVQYSTVQYSTVQYSTVQFIILLYSTVTVHYSTLG